MKTSAKHLISELNRLSKWVAKLTRKKHGGDDAIESKVEDIIVGCFDLMDYSPTFDQSHWLARRKRRSILIDQPDKAAFTADGIRSIQELVELVISEVEACKAFRPDIEVGVLPINPPPSGSAKHLQTARNTAKLAAERRRDEQAQSAARIDAIVAAQVSA